jgi:anaerobic dimethyl sulfoxide reductase subunit A
MSFTEFKKRGTYQIHRNADDNLSRVNDLNAYVLAPGHTSGAGDVQLNTETGRLEIYCMALQRYYRQFGFETDIYMHPTAKYLPARNGYEEAVSNGTYDVQMISVHPLHRSHSGRSDKKSIQEIYSDIVYMNRIDAEKYGLNNGDTALLTSRIGKVLRRVSLISTVIPGVVVMTEGATTKYNDDETIDIGGNPDSLCETVLCGEGHMPFNTNIVKIEHWNGEPLTPNYKWPLDEVTFASDTEG